MKYSLETEIDCPRDTVFELLSNPDNLSSWQADLLSYELESGQSGQPGARARLLYKIGKKQYEMHETLIESRRPELLKLEVEARGVWNQVVNTFTELEGGRTLWRVDTEFRCRGLMWFITLVMPGVFKTQTENYMRQFKSFVQVQQGGVG